MKTQISTGITCFFTWFLVTCTSDHVNVALSDYGTQAHASTNLPNHDAHQILDGNMMTGWAFEAELDSASIIVVFKLMVAADSVRLFSGLGGGQQISRFRLMYTTSLPDNVADRAFLSSPKWRDLSSITCDVDGVDILEGTVFTTRPDVILSMPLMLLRGIKVVVEDALGDTFGAVLNQVQVLVPLQHNPGLGLPRGVEFPAKQYIWPLYNAATQEHDASSVWFEWRGPLSRNESVVFGLLEADVEVHNFAVPVEGSLELYVQLVIVAKSEEGPRLVFSVAELPAGLQVLTARVRGRDGELRPEQDVRTVFVSEKRPTHPWLVRHRVEAVGDGLAVAQVGGVSRFRVHIHEVTAGERRPEDEEGAARGEACGEEAEARGGCEETGGGGGGGGGEGEGGEGPWEAEDPEFFTVTLRGPSIVSGAARRVGRGVYDAWYTVEDPGRYAMAVVLHYVEGGGLHDPGVGGEEDVVEHLVGGRVWEVQATAEGLGVCYGNRTEGNAWRDPRREERECGREEAGSVRGRWVHREAVCGGRVGEAAGGKGGCEMGGEEEEWAWAAVGCKYRRYSPLEAQECTEERGRRVLVAGASPQRTLFFDLADLLLPGEVAAAKAHQDLHFPPALFFHWIPYNTKTVAGCPLDCQLDYDNLTGHVADFVSRQGSGGADVLVVQAGIHDIFFGSLRTFARNINVLAAALRRLRHASPVDALYRVGDMLHLPRGGDLGLVEHGFRSQRMVAALQRARRVMLEAGVPVLDTLQTTLGRPEGTADGYHFNEWARLNDPFHGNAIARTNAHILMNRACNGVAGSGPPLPTT